MELIEINIMESYQVFKQELDTQMYKTAEDFVRIGYLLRIAEETNILAESGYSNVVDFARAEYNIDKTQVSRFININKKYSEGGRAPELAQQYRQFGFAKLAEMLTLPDAIVEEISPDMTKEEIRTIKEEYNSEQKISDIEVMIEEKPVIEEKLVDEGIRYKPEDNIEYLLLDFFKENKAEFKRISALDGDNYNAKTVFDIMAPAGSRTIIGRVPQVGRLIMSIRSHEQDITITNMRTQDKENITWSSFLDYLDNLTNYTDKPESLNEQWRYLYGEPFEDVRPQEDKKPQEEEKPKKASKVTVTNKVAPAQPKAEPKEEPPAIAQKEKEEENQEEKPVIPEEPDTPETEEPAEIPNEPKEKTKDPIMAAPEEPDTSDSEDEYRYAYEVIKIQMPALLRYIDSRNIDAAINSKITIDNMFSKILKLSGKGVK